MAGRDDAHRLGWLGVGRMGVEMGRRLLSAGCDLAVFNRTMSKAELLIRLGDLEQKMDSTERGLIASLKAKVQEMHDAWFEGIMGRKK